MSPMSNDFLCWKGMPGDAVYGRKMDLCWVYDMENTDSVVFGIDMGKQAKYCEL